MLMSFFVRITFLLTAFLLTGCTVLTGQKKFTTRKTTSAKALALYKSGTEALNRREYDKALTYLNRALRKDARFVDALIRIGQVHHQLEHWDQAEQAYRRALDLAPDYKPVLYLSLADIAMARRQYEQAIRLLQKYIHHPRAQAKRIEIARRKLANARFSADAIKHPQPFHPKNLGPHINTKWPEYLPSFTADEQFVIFTRRVNGQEDFYISRRDSTGRFGPARPLTDINTPENEGAQCISSDGRHLAMTVCGRNRTLYGSCDLNITHKRHGKWQALRNIGAPVNSPYWDAQPCFSANGDALYFASDRPGGKGKRDIWVCYRKKDGHWSTPENLGDSINTPGNDQAPFIHPDGQTLYFMSDGHPGMGGSDLFMSRRRPDGQWGRPVNLGYPINDRGNQGALVVSLDGKTGYFAGPKASAQPGDYFGGAIDIFSFEMPPALRPRPVTYVKAVVLDGRTQRPVAGARVELTDLKSGHKAADLVTDEQGRFLCVLARGRYGMQVDKEQYLFFSRNYVLTDDNSLAKPYTLTVHLQPIPADTDSRPAVTVLRNVFFDSGSATLKPESYFELAKLVELLKANPGLRIRINGHTDNVGSDADNLRLSEARAKAVYNYLVREGIAADRLAYKGFGESRPIAPNDTEEGRRLNRRTEVETIQNIPK